MGNMDGFVDPYSGGQIEKIGENLYKGKLSRTLFKRDDGNLGHLRPLLEPAGEGFFALLDPNCGQALKQLDEDVFYSQAISKTYVAVKSEDLENPEFNAKLQKIYDGVREKQNGYFQALAIKEVDLVIDGEILEDPDCGRTVNKIGTNLYQSPITKNKYFLEDGKLVAFREPIAETDLELQEDGRYYSKALHRHFTLEKAPNGKSKFFPTYLPYDGMTNVNARVEGDRLVGENGISLPITENGLIDFPTVEGLKTQEEIDKNLEEKAAYNKAYFDRLEALMAGEEPEENPILSQKAIEAIDRIVYGDDQTRSTEKLMYCNVNSATKTASKGDVEKGINDIEQAKNELHKGIDKGEKESNDDIELS